ncbi:PilZ domain-containing protein [Novosphingobium bradum]|uniref:PilZ domain-containing protein n=1 Tax=Novosphingobium bradum TaxID=1737444 RepID=A0ABV7ITU0_9SPHN
MHDPVHPGQHGSEGSDQRAAPRVNLLIRPAKLVAPCGEYLCVLRDASASGVKVRCFHPLPAQAMVLELGNGDRFEVERVWEQGDHAGLRFRGAVPVEYLIKESGPYPRRPVRLRLVLPALLVAGRDALHATVHDLSQQGARIECAEQLAINRQFRLEIAGLAPIIAKVRWRRPPAAGLVFEDTFRLEDFARLAFRLQPLPAPPGELDDSPFARRA